ncbi:Os05g0171900 [Oryza sativa Japonica Group]|uniref:Os05g0171900 protein n=1 Tax=Oryza sativa subsp. japonica TaxID=39947 RepID=A0A0P0WII9_ORYSJ|nr:hypothetical protein EE612_027412 [Oryza sativa]BAS92495.1 Os05g0171900 [Oryza sativa Japonica Group]
MVNTAAVAAAKGSRGSGLPLASLNHISIVCRSLQESLTFYTDVLGFFPVRRPGSFDFDGAWLKILTACQGKQRSILKIITSPSRYVWYTRFGSYHYKYCNTSHSPS